MNIAISKHKLLRKPNNGIYKCILVLIAVFLSALMDCRLCKGFVVHLGFV